MKNIFEVGDKVFDHNYGPGVVRSNERTQDIPVMVEFSDRHIEYMENGRLPSSLLPTLAHLKEPAVNAWIQTASGGVFDFLHPETNTISIKDIAASLSKICRYRKLGRL